MDAFEGYLGKKFFCSYKLVPRGDKMTKIPCNIQGEAINVFDNTSFITLKEVLGAKMGVGLCFTGCDLVGIDLDKCFGTGFAERIIEYFRSYTEVSCSGTGYHIIVRVPDLPPGYRSSRKVGQKMQIFCNYGYFALTFNQYKYKQITECPFESLAVFSDVPKSPVSEVTSLSTSIIAPTEGDVKKFDKYLSVSTPAKKAKVLALFDCDTEEKLRVLNYPSFSEADMALANYLVYGLGDKESAVRVFAVSNLWSKRPNKHSNDYIMGLFDKISKKSR